MSVLYPVWWKLLTHPLRPFVVDDRKSWKGCELLAASLILAEEIERKTDAPHVGVMLPTSGLFPVAAIASWMLGRAIVPLNYLLKADDLQYVCDHADIDTLITVQPMLDFVGGCPARQRVIRMDDLDFKRLPEWRWPRWSQPDDLALILYTSGTSGRPKGVMLTHGNLSANIRQCIGWADVDQRDVILGILPQFHVFGLTVLTLMPMWVGARAVFASRFVPRKVIDLLRAHRPTVMVGIPSMYNALMTVKDARDDDFASLRYVISGGEPLPDDVARRFRERFGRTLDEGYGMTETSAVTHWCRPEEHRAHSVGKALDGVRVRIVHESGRDLGPNEEGEIRVAGPNIMRGYYKQPDETARTFDSQGYLRTGDMGRVDEDGFLFITGRIKEMLIIGGENVFPREIEEVLNRHPAVKDSGVVGIPDPMRGEAPVAFVEMAEGAEFNERELIAWCRQSLPGYKAPAEIRRIDALPRNPTGKVMRRELKAMLGDAAASPA